MNEGLVLTAASVIAGIGNLATHYPKITGNRATLRPGREQAVMILVILLAVAGFLLQPGLAGYLLGGIALVPALLFLLATATSGLPVQKLAVEVGAPAPDFSAVDAQGRAFRLSELRGAPVLLKF